MRAYEITEDERAFCVVARIMRNRVIAKGRAVRLYMQRQSRARAHALRQFSVVCALICIHKSLFSSLCPRALPLYLTLVSHRARRFLMDDSIKMQLNYAPEIVKETRRLFIRLPRHGGKISHSLCEFRKIFSRPEISVDVCTNVFSQQQHKVHSSKKFPRRKRRKINSRGSM